MIQAVVHSIKCKHEQHASHDAQIHRFSISIYDLEIPLVNSV